MNNFFYSDVYMSLYLIYYYFINILMKKKIHKLIDKHLSISSIHAIQYHPKDFLVKFQNLFI